jgi:hypothetical protein
VPLPPPTPPEPAVIESDLPQTRSGDIYSASGNVVVTFRDRILRADSVTYDRATGNVILLGHVHVTGGENDESILATHGIYNLNTQTGTFYDVSGSVGLSNQMDRTGYVTENPFLFSGRKVVKTGPVNYIIYEGSVTSCLLPHPDWLLIGSKFTLDSKNARASNSTFKLLGIPVFFSPTSRTRLMAASVSPAFSSPPLDTLLPAPTPAPRAFPSETRSTSSWAAPLTSLLARSITHCAASQRTAPSATVVSETISSTPTSPPCRTAASAPAFPSLTPKASSPRP